MPNPSQSMQQPQQQQPRYYQQQYPPHQQQQQHQQQQPPPQQIQPQPRPQPQPQPQPQPEPEPMKQPSPQPQPKPKPKPKIKEYTEYEQRRGPRFEEPTSLFNVDDEDYDEKKEKEKKGWGWGWGKKKESTKKESNLKCLCGATLIYLDVKQAYKGKKVYCDICSKVCKQCIFHCPSGDIKSHPGGFDLCYQCGGSQLAKQPNPSPTDMLLTTDTGYAQSQSSSSSMAYPSLKPSAPPAPSPNKDSKTESTDNYDSNFVYPSQLKQLLDMGFDKDKSRRLLLKNRGNMSQVLAELIK